MRSTWKPGWLFLLLALVAALSLFVAACGGDDDDGGDDGGDDPTETVDAGDNEGDDDGDDDDATETDDAGDDDDGGDDGGDDDDGSLADLEDLAADYENFEGSVTYEIEGFEDDELTKMRIVQKGASSVFATTSAGEESIFINTPEATYICSDDSCLQYPAGDAVDPTGFFSGLFSAEAIQAEIGDLIDDVEVEQSTEEIAGLDATCFSYEGDVDPEVPGDESGQFCFAEGGILLKAIFNATEGSGTFTAIEASNEVDDSEFDPPYPVTDLSDLGQ